jgi:plasmid stabilization system protein ParE
VARVFWAESARSALDQLILSHSLPADTRDRVKRSLLPLGRFPRLGPEIAQLEDGKELRFLIGPRPWLVLVYIYDDETDRVTVVSPEDGRAAASTVTRQDRGSRE